MTDKDKLTLRKPLASKDDDVECKTAYEELLKEFAELKEWKVDGVDFVLSSDKAHAVSLEEYNARMANIPLDAISTTRSLRVASRPLRMYRPTSRSCVSSVRLRVRQVMTFRSGLMRSGGDEVPSPFPEDDSLMERDIEEWKRQSEICNRRYREFLGDQRKVFGATSARLKLWREQYEEECKFEEIQKAADKVFEYAAKHTLADGSGRMLTDEELAEREKRKQDTTQQ